MNISQLKKLGTAALLGAGMFAVQASLAQSANCKYVVTNSWGAGATASIEITNTGTTALNGWNVSWTYVNNRITSSWNATLAGTNPYSASNLSWNGNVQPGKTVSFGVQVNTNGAVETPVVTGAICGAASSVASSLRSSTAPSSVASSIAPSSRSSASSLQPSSSAVSLSSRSSASSSATSACAVVPYCNWYGTMYPVCISTQSGWGYENNKSCISTSTCTSQPSPFGVVGSCGLSSSSLSSSSIRSSSSTVLSSSSIRSSSSSSIISSSSSSMRSSSSLSSSSSSASGVIPNATASGWPYCRSADSDPDGDGWGWENAYSCIVYGSAPDGGAGNFSYCMIGSSKLNLCATDNGSWGFQSGAVCLSKSMCPGMGSATQAPARTAPVNTNADTTTKTVFTYLKSIWGNHMLSGQQDLTWQDNIDQYQRVINDTGRAPAIMGYDFMNYGMWAGNPGLAQTEEAIVHWNRGGLVTFAWHWRDPNAASNSIGAFYTADTNFSIPLVNGQLDTSSTSFANMQADIALIAAELQKLENAGVTVLWRPLHEASGGWFWWGRNDRADGLPAAYAQVVLWRYLYDRLTNFYGLNNLIWVWNGQSAAWYPGDAYVDIVSHDIYDGNRNYESQASVFNMAKGYSQESKMVALSENSNIPNPDLMQQDNVWWLYFVVWNDTDTAEGVTSSSNFWTGEYYNTNAHKVHVYNHERVLTLDELPNF
ncbi:glycosyl hydrolase [Cellvibrio sp.]